MADIYEVGKWRKVAASLNQFCDLWHKLITKWRKVAVHWRK